MTPRHRGKGWSDSVAGLVTGRDKVGCYITYKDHRGQTRTRWRPYTEIRPATPAELARLELDQESGL